MLYLDIFLPEADLILGGMFQLEVGGRKETNRSSPVPAHARLRPAD